MTEEFQTDSFTLGTPVFGEIDPVLDPELDLPLQQEHAQPCPKKNRRGRCPQEHDYSAEMRQRFQKDGKGKRTARACDRCKCRKLPCDKNPMGCQNCITAGVECNATDPITCETHPRNIIMKMAMENEQLKSELSSANNCIQALKKYLLFLENEIDRQKQYEASQSIMSFANTPFAEAQTGPFEEQTVQQAYPSLFDDSQMSGTQLADLDEIVSDTYRMFPA